MRQGDYEMRIELVDQDDNEKFAHYGHFDVAPASFNYKLSVDDYSGNAGTCTSMLYCDHNNQVIK